MKKTGIVGVVAGIAAGAAAAVAGGMAVARVVKEMKADPQETRIVSPDGNNYVTLSLGVSAFGKGLTLVKVMAQTEGGEDTCKFSFIAGRGAKYIHYQWVDNENFELTVGKGVLQQCCDVTFGGEEIHLLYYWHKLVAESNEETAEEVAEEVVEEVTEEVVEEVVEEVSDETVEKNDSPAESAPEA